MSTQAFSETLNQIRLTQPLVHNITNYVVMNWTANCLLALGASPVMAHAAEEVEEMVGISGSLVINLGTLSPPWVTSMSTAMTAAARLSVPTVFDPVGVGATRYRTETSRRLLDQNPPSVIRGNASEVLALAGEVSVTHGVDSRALSEEALDAAQALVRKYGSVVCITGPTDFVVSDGGVQSVTGGHSIMSRVTGMGCAGTAVIGAFCALKVPPAAAALQALTLMGVAGELAAAESRGPGSFQTAFLDVLYRMEQP